MLDPAGTVLSVAFHITDLIAFVIPNPPPEVPPGLEVPANRVLGFLKWGAIIAGIGGLLVSAIMISGGRSGRNQIAMSGITGTFYALGGLAVASAASLLVGVFVF